MGRIAELAETHWRKYLPQGYRQIGDRVAFFEELETEAERLIEEMATALEGTAPEGETFLDKAARLRMARYEAEATVLRELVLRELVLLDPVTAETERAPGQPDPESPEDRMLREAIVGFHEARLELQHLRMGPTDPPMQQSQQTA